MSPKFLVEGMLDAALAGILHAHGSEYLRCQIARGIKALRLFARINASKVQRIEFGGDALVEAPHDPNELLICLFPFFQMIGE